MIALDTNIVIAYLNDDRSVVEAINLGRSQNERFCISAVTATELLAFPKLTPREVSLFKTWLQESVFVVGIDASLAMLAGDICRTAHIKTADGLVAATAMRMFVPLATRDKDFRRVLGLTLVTM